jgi:phospholipid-transporting ATPase
MRPEGSKLGPKEAEMTSKYGNHHINKSEKHELLHGARDIEVGQPERFFPDNSISTTKYTVYNFFFVNLFEQFSKIANLYFLFLAFLQMIKLVSITGGIPTILPPLAFIVLLTMIKDVYEDYKRYKSDEEENNKETLVYDNGKFVTMRWKDVRVGQILKVVKNQFFPADLVLLSSSDYRKGICFIETKNLDGETNLKTKNVCDDLKDQIKSDDDALRLSSKTVNAEGPNQYLSVFKGSFQMNGSKLPLSSKNFLLRGCTLRNTDYILGCAVYTG